MQIHSKTSSEKSVRNIFTVVLCKWDVRFMTTGSPQSALSIVWTVRIYHILR